jgi:hypothetical protein
MATFVLVHGAFGSPAAPAPLIPELEALGHRAIAMQQPWPGRALPAVPSAYLLCTQDNIIPPAVQREMAARLGLAPTEIASDHAVFTLEPRALAQVLAAQVRST